MPTANLNRVQRPDLEHWLFQSWSQHHTLPLTASQQQVASALVHLRRSGKSCYSAHSHLRQLRTETLDYALLLDTAERTAYALASRVNILGEPHAGLIIHLEMGWDCDDPYPAPWYVVAAPSRQRCRAHGSDEIEAC